MYQEKTLLQEENNHLRMRVRALQDTIDAQVVKITKLTTEKVTKMRSNNSDNANGDEGIGEEEEENVMENIIGNYIKEIEELRYGVILLAAILSN